MTLSIFIYVRNRGRGGFGDWVCPGCVAGSWPGYILLYLKSPRRDHSASRRLAQRKHPCVGTSPAVLTVGVLGAGAWRRARCTPRSGAMSSACGVVTAASSSVPPFSHT